MEEYNKMINDWQELILSRYNCIQLAALIDSWYDRDIESFSKKGLEWAEKSSWKKLKPLYREVL